MVDRFPVFFLSTEASEREGLRGPLQIVSYKFHVGVARVGDKDCFVLWHISVIRQYRLESEKKNNNNNSNNKVSNSSTKRKSFFFSETLTGGSKAMKNNLSVVTIEVGR